MTRDEFRKARVTVKRDMLSEGMLCYDRPGYTEAHALFYDNRFDPLAARLSGFTTSAHSRIKLYPLRTA